ncbi:unnamed protein product [Eruca vesicaria subsp. sativa]|uniref:Uncharacterized protein n=1 Tax=Eruca vesicaria subsp. sativa TaxID=29727 RepID=A0ABC8LEY6_ERUVS|nr:unnamed protein product [Eruca vesicaria subsp. sativa]
MPGSHGEITLVEQNRVVTDNKKTKKKKDGVENGNQLVTKPKKGFTERFRKKQKSSSGECKGGCFSVMRHRRTEEEEEEEGSPSSSDPKIPNDECFSHEMMRVMLEKNDFFSDECNPHR